MPSPFDIPTGPSPFAQEAAKVGRVKHPSKKEEELWVIQPIKESVYTDICTWLRNNRSSGNQEKITLTTIPYDGKDTQVLTVSRDEVIALDELYKQDFIAYHKVKKQTLTNWLVSSTYGLGRNHLQQKWGALVFGPTKK
jgi:hypothetical protein